MLSHETIEARLTALEIAVGLRPAPAPEPEPEPVVEEPVATTVTTGSTDDEA